MRVVPRAVIASASEPRAQFSGDRRLHKPSEFAAVLAVRRVFRGDSFDLHFLEAQNQDQARLGLIVPKRMAREASLRNAIKRQGREAFRLSMVRGLACDVVLRLKRPVSGFTIERRQQLRSWRREIESLLDKLAQRAA